MAAGLLMAASMSAQAPADRHDVRSGNKRFKKERFQEADIWYRKALVKDSTSVAANYNLANTMYRLQNWEEAGKYYDKIAKTAAVSGHGADYWYNAGNLAVQKQDWRKAVESYGRSLLINPDDLDAKENYAYARQMLKNNPNGGGGGNDGQNQDQNQNQQNQDNQQNQNDQNNQDQNNDQNQDKQDQNQDQQNQGQQPQDGQGQQQDVKISPQQAQQMLQAIQAKEKETQDKVNKEKAAVLKSRQKEKNW